VSVRRGTLLLIAVLAGTGLVACGGDDDSSGGSSIASLSADEILAKTKTAVTAAKSVHASGDSVDDDGNKVKIDFRLSDGGTTGSVTSQGATIEILVVGSDFYMKASKEAWQTLTGEAAAGELLAGRYVKVPSTQKGFSGIESLADWDSFVKEALTPEGTPTKGETKQLAGVEVIGLVDSKDDGTLWIPTEDDPLPVQADTSDGTVMKFTEWGAPVSVKAPPAEEVIDLGELSR
jgi:hypothetical protein